MGYRMAVLVGTLGIGAATALAAATPVTPPPGALDLTLSSGIQLDAAGEPAIGGALHRR